MMSEKLWILKSKGEKSAFGGNEGYADELEDFYVFDTTVKNHNKIKAGDYVLLVDKYHILGSAVVERIAVTEQVVKQRFSCPECGTKEFYSRASLLPRYKCRKKHEFDTPRPEDITVSEYRAHYSSSFQAAGPKVSVKVLDGHYIKRNIYYSIQQADRAFVGAGSAEAGIVFKTLSPSSASKKRVMVFPDKDYEPDGGDERNFSIGKIALRPSQDSFRAALFDIYGTKCMVSGCDVALAIEASHICAFRGEKDNHPQNGILLRRDLHALWDSGLIGIEPEGLKIHLSETLAGSVYEEFSGQVLQVDEVGLAPSRSALALRWKLFLASSRK